MKIRTKEEFIDSLSENMNWRRKEITTLNLLIQRARPHEKIILMRAALVLFYSHWEGYIKHCAIAYLEFLNSRGLKYNKLTENFHCLSLSEKFKKGFSISRIRSQIDIYKYLSTIIKDETFKVTAENIIDTESNLKYLVFENILLQLGIATDSFQTRENFIDQTMLLNRNAIAHGEFKSDKDIESAYNELNTEILPLMENFRTHIENAVVSSSYLVSS